MFKVGDRIVVTNSPIRSRVGQYGIVAEYIDNLVRAKMDNYAIFADCMVAGHYSVSIYLAEKRWALAGPRKSNKGFAKFIRNLEGTDE